MLRTQRRSSLQRKSLPALPGRLHRSSSRKLGQPEDEKENFSPELLCSATSSPKKEKPLDRSRACHDDYPACHHTQIDDFARGRTFPPRARSRLDHLGSRIYFHRTPRSKLLVKRGKRLIIERLRGRAPQPSKPQHPLGSPSERSRNERAHEPHRGNEFAQGINPGSICRNPVH